MLKPGNQGKPKRRIKAIPSKKSTEAVVQKFSVKKLFLEIS